MYQEKLVLKIGISMFIFHNVIRTMDIFGWVNIYKIATIDLKYGAHYPLKLCFV
jgi:hypothetical protein